MESRNLEKVYLSCIICNPYYTTQVHFYGWYDGGSECVPPEVVRGILRLAMVCMFKHLKNMLSFRNDGFRNSRMCFGRYRGKVFISNIFHSQVKLIIIGEVRAMGVWVMVCMFRHLKNMLSFCKRELINPECASVDIEGMYSSLTYSILK